jgi:hypothetical protein
VPELAKFNATFCLLNRIVESDFVSQNITSVLTNFSGVVVVVSVEEEASFLFFEHPLTHIKNKIMNIPANELKYALELIAALLNNKL